jgi:hypothetical protein
MVLEDTPFAMSSFPLIKVQMLHAVDTLFAMSSFSLIKAHIPHAVDTLFAMSSCSLFKAHILHAVDTLFAISSFFLIKTCMLHAVDKLFAMSSFSLIKARILHAVDVPLTWLIEPAQLHFWGMVLRAFKGTYDPLKGACHKCMDAPFKSNALHTDNILCVWPAPTCMRHRSPTRGHACHKP